MTEMIERVARAMCAQVEKDNPTELSPQWIDDCWPYYINQTKAAIEAMMMPTDEMVDAMSNNLPEPSHIDEGCWDNPDCPYQTDNLITIKRIEAAYQAMIKEALGKE